MSTHTRLFVISGPSGAGKGTLVSLLRENHPSLALTVSATTRKPRPGEEDGVSYHFLSTEAFESLLAQDGFVEWARVHNNYYGTLKSEVEACFKQGHSVVLEIDPQGAFQVKDQDPAAVLIFIAPPSAEELERRLRARGTESEDQIALRLAHARIEMELASRYDEIVVNDQIDEALEALIAIIRTYEDDDTLSSSSISIPNGEV